MIGFTKPGCSPFCRNFLQVSRLQAFHSSWSTEFTPTCQSNAATCYALHGDQWQIRLLLFVYNQCPIKYWPCGYLHVQGHLIAYINQLILQLCELSNQTTFEQKLFKMVCTKQTEEKRQTIDRMKQRIGMDLAMMYVNYGMYTDVRDKLMKKMGWTATECIEWDERKREGRLQEIH